MRQKIKYRFNLYEMQKGGVQLKDGFMEDDALKYFIENSEITILSTSSTDGIILTLTLDVDKPSSYSTIRQGVVEDVDRMILKIVIITPREVEIRIGSDNFKTYYEATNVEFNAEVSKQQRLFEATHHTNIDGDLNEDYGEALCPCIIHSGIYSKTYDNGNPVKPDHVDTLIRLRDLLKSKMIRDRIDLIGQLFEKMLDDENENVKLGFIFMEFAEGYQTMDSLMIKYKDEIYSTQRRECRSIALIELSRLNDNGIHHNDFHQGNILINYAKKRGMIIDFGRSQDIPIRTQIVLNQKKGVYGPIMRIFYSLFFEVSHYRQDDPDWSIKCRKNRKGFYFHDVYVWMFDILTMMGLIDFDNNCNPIFNPNNFNYDINPDHFSNVIKSVIEYREGQSRTTRLEPTPRVPMNSRTTSVARIFSPTIPEELPIIQEELQEEVVENDLPLAPPSSSSSSPSSSSSSSPSSSSSSPPFFTLPPQPPSPPKSHPRARHSTSPLLKKETKIGFFSKIFSKKNGGKVKRKNRRSKKIMK
jgi:hypothetical protein